MRKLFAALLVAALLLVAAAPAEEGEFGFDFGDEGYTGEWTPIPELGLEFCLPDGWATVEAEEGASFSARSGDGRASMSIALADTGVVDLVAWGEGNLELFDVEDAGLSEALVVEEGEQIRVFLLAGEDDLIRFDFARDGADALSRDFALEIAGSAYEGWEDEAFDLDWGEDLEGFDFADAFEEDML